MPATAPSPATACANAPRGYTSENKADSANIATNVPGKQILLFAKAFSFPRKATRGTSSVLDKDARHNLTMEVPIPFVFIEVLRFLHNR